MNQPEELLSKRFVMSPNQLFFIEINFSRFQIILILDNTPVKIAISIDFFNGSTQVVKKEQDIHTFLISFPIIFKGTFCIYYR